MLRLVSLLVLLPLVVSAAETPAIVATELAAPAAGTGVLGPSVTLAPDGTTWLTWLETAEGRSALRCATLAPSAAAWSPARTIASGSDWFLNAADFPALTAGPDGRATAVWFVNNPADASAHGHGHHGPGYRAFVSHTADAGASWSAPVPLTNDSDSVEFVSLATLADGRVLAAWLDGRGKKSGGKAQQVWARIVSPATNGPDTLVDASVCDCCQTALTAFPDGSALLAYRGRSEDEVRDIRVTRFRGQAWDEPRPLNHDDWRIAGCPVNGPQFASDGGRVGVAWFTAADNDPRVLASFSPDAGGRFLLPLRLSDAKPAGRVSTILLHDGAMLVSWVDGAGALALRRVTPDYSPGATQTLTRPEQGRIKGFPRLALRRDYRGGKSGAQIVAAFTTEAAPMLRTLLIDVPEGALLEAAQDCGCTPSPEELQGYPIRGTLVSVEADRGVARVKHPEVPGLFPAGTRDFQIAAGALAPGAQPGRQFLGRVERTANGWKLFDVRLIAAPQP